MKEKKLSDAEFKVTIIDEKGNKVYETSEGRTEKQEVTDLY